MRDYNMYRRRYGLRTGYISVSVQRAVGEAIYDTFFVSCIRHLKANLNVKIPLINLTLRRQSTLNVHRTLELTESTFNARTEKSSPITCRQELGCGRCLSVDLSYKYKDKFPMVSIRIECFGDVEVLLNVPG